MYNTQITTCIYMYMYNIIMLFSFKHEKVISIGETVILILKYMMNMYLDFIMKKYIRFSQFSSRRLCSLRFPTKNI